jgi:hypothetical protein
MNINRRHFLGLLGTGLSAASMISTGWGDNSDMTLCELFFSAYGDEEGRYGVAAIDTAGEVRFAIQLPGRAHAIAIHPETAHCVVMARRPGTFAVVSATTAVNTLELRRTNNTKRQAIYQLTGFGRAGKLRGGASRRCPW